MYLLNDEEQQSLDENGFVKFSLFNEEQAQYALGIYQKYNAEQVFQKGLHYTANQISEESYKLTQLLLDDFSPVLQEKISNFKFIQSSFIVKKNSSPESLVPPHQDWSFVDESSRFNSYTLWIMVSEADEDMGAIGFVKESHKKLLQIRYTPEGQFPGLDYLQNTFKREEEEFFSLKKGEAVLWNNRTIHMTLPNLSNEDRVVMAFGLCDEEAQLKLYFKSPTEDKL